MTKLIYTVIVALLLGAAPIATHAEVKPLAPSGSAAWAGTWSAEGQTITIVSHGGFLDILGKDGASIFTLTCILADVPNRDRAECIGHGINHNSTLRFLYKSTMQINGEGRIVETWQADAWTATFDKRKSITGTAKFEKAKAAPTKSE